MPAAQYTDRLFHISSPVEKKIPISSRSSIIAAYQDLTSCLRPGTQTEGFSLDKRRVDRLNKMNEYSFILATFLPLILEGVLNSPWNRS
jgi:hypothetical protein